MSDDQSPTESGSTGSPGPLGPGILASAESASLLRRLGGICLDWAACLVIARLALPGVAYGSGTSALATLIIFFIEVSLFTWLTASSFGQRIVGIAVLSTLGRRLSLWNVLIRTVLICLVIPALVYDSRGRGLQDLVAGSVVVMRRSIPGLAR